jgi:3-hydroxyisobutyrate dehydrogenase-like beta-hydroxyacid dehydrogenase
MRMIIDEGTRVGAAVPAAQVMLDLVEEAAKIGWGEEDMIAITKVLAARKTDV